MTKLWRTVVRYPPTWLVVVLSLGLGAALVSWFSPGVVGTLVIGGLVAVVLGVWPVAMQLSGTFGRLARREEQRRLAATDPLPALRAELARLPGRRPLEQFDDVREQGDNLTAILGRRLDAGEVTYARYLTATRSVVDAVTHNLSEVALAHQSISTIEVPGVERRLAELTGAPGAPAEQERQSLTARLQLSREQQERIDALLAENESAMTALARTTTTIGRTTTGGPPVVVAGAMAELETLAERASRYASG